MEEKILYFAAIVIIIELCMLYREFKCISTSSKLLVDLMTSDYTQSNDHLRLQTLLKQVKNLQRQNDYKKLSELQSANHGFLESTELRAGNVISLVNQIAEVLDRSDVPVLKEGGIV